MENKARQKMRERRRRNLRLWWFEDFLFFFFLFLSLFELDWKGRYGGDGVLVVNFPLYFTSMIMFTFIRIIWKARFSVHYSLFSVHWKRKFIIFLISRFQRSWASSCVTRSMIDMAKRCRVMLLNHNPEDHCSRAIQSIHEPIGDWRYLESIKEEGIWRQERSEM